jgi:hypothetical protein
MKQDLAIFEFGGGMIGLLRVDGGIEGRGL